MYFAEFLHHDYLDRLSILYLTTCVGLGYGPLKPRAEAFLGSIGLSNSYHCTRHQTSGYTNSGFAYCSPYILERGQPSPRLTTFLRHSC